MWIGLRKEFKLNVRSPASAPRLLNILLRKLPGKVFEKFQIFSDTTADYAGFRLWGTAGCQRAVVGTLPTTRSRSEPQVTHLLSRRGVGQLSVERWGRHTPGRRACEQASSLFFARNFLADALLRISMKLSTLNNVLAKESAVLCAMNMKISFKSLPDPVRNG